MDPVLFRGDPEGRFEVLSCWWGSRAGRAKGAVEGREVCWGAEDVFVLGGGAFEVERDGFIQGDVCDFEVFTDTVVELLEF